VGYVSADLPEGVFIDSEPTIDFSGTTASDNQSGAGNVENPVEEVVLDAPVDVTLANNGDSHVKADGSANDGVPAGVSANVYIPAGGSENGGEIPVEPGSTPPNPVGRGVNRTSTSSSSSRKTKRMSNAQGIGDALTRLGKDRKEVHEKSNEVAQKRNELYEKDVSTREKDVIIRERDAAARETYMKDTVSMKKEYLERKNSKALFAEWETVGNAITRMRYELRKEGIDDETKEELESDIKQLKLKKRKLSEKMGLV
jgi:hypothetical protein